MSPPDTNLETQEKRHRPALTGIIVSVIIAVLGILALVFWLSASGDAPEGAEVQIDGRTGDPVATE